MGGGKRLGACIQIGPEGTHPDASNCFCYGNIYCTVLLLQARANILELFFEGDVVLQHDVCGLIALSSQHKLYRGAHHLHCDSRVATAGGLHDVAWLGFEGVGCAEHWRLRETCMQVASRRSWSSESIIYRFHG